MRFIHSPLQTGRTLIELYKTGEIRSTAKGDNILLDARGNLSGDILIFIGPLNNNLASTADIMELVRTDSKLHEQRKIVMESLERKFLELAFLPYAFAWTLNVIFLYYSFLRPHFDNAIEIIRMTNYPTHIVSYLPLIVPALTIFFGKPIGFLTLKPLILLIVKIARLIKRIRNRKVEEMQN